MRFHPNPALSAASESLVVSRESLASCLRSVVSHLEAPRASHSRGTVYTGGAGLAYALWRAGYQQQDASQVAVASQLIEACYEDTLKHSNRYVPESLLDGFAGVVLVKALVNHAPAADNSPDKNPGDLKSLLATYRQCCETALDSPYPSDEFLYGRVGTLFGALLLNEQFGSNAIPRGPMQQLVHAVLHSGRSLASQVPQLGTALLYVWPPGRHASPYLGAAHGLMGITYVLLHCGDLLEGQEQQQAWQDIQEVLRYILTLEGDAPGRAGKGGHYPVMVPVDPGAEPKDQGLVHWCHGAPGAILLLCKAAEVFPQDAETYLAAACRSGELVWEQGLLTKGPGLCHGVSGNGYALLRLYKATQDEAWLLRSQYFASFMCSAPGQADWHTPDHPVSLFEGLAGGVCLLSDLVHSPQAASFPLFELGRAASA